MAVVQTGTNTYTFYFDNNINNYSTQEMVDLFTTTSTTNVYYISENDEFILRNPEYGYSGTITFSASDTNISFTLSYQGPGNGICKYPQDNTWLITQGNFKVSNIKGFKLENVNLAENQTLETINNLVNPYIGTKTSLSLQFTRTKASIKIYEDLTQEEYDALTKEPHAFYLVNGVGIYKGTTLISAGANSSMDEIVEELNQAIAAKQDTLVSGTNIKTINGESILGAGNIEVAASDDGVDTAYVENEVLYIDDDTSAGGNASLTEDDVNNIISSNETVVTLTNDVRDLQTDKQDILESGTNIKTINNQSILGSGNIEISGGSGGGSGEDNTYELVLDVNNLTDEQFTRLFEILPTIIDACSSCNKLASFIFEKGDQEYIEVAFNIVDLPPNFFDKFNNAKYFKLAISGEGEKLDIATLPLRSKSIDNNIYDFSDEFSSFGINTSVLTTISFVNTTTMLLAGAVDVFLISNELKISMYIKGVSLTNNSETISTQ